MATWIFQGNPDRFDMDGYVAAGLPQICWTLKRYADQIAVGDEVYLWRSAGSGRGKEGAEAGIFALARVSSEPWEGQDQDEAHPFSRSTGDAASVETRVWLVVEKVADKKGVIRRDWLAEDPICGELLIIKQPAGTNYPVSAEQAGRLRALWSRTGKDWTRAESLAALRTYNQTYGGPLSKVAGSPTAELALTIGRAVGGAYNKILNFRAIDPRDTRKGLDGAGEMDRDVWAEFYDPTTESIRAEALEAEFQSLWSPGRSPVSDVAESEEQFAREVRKRLSQTLEELLLAYRSRTHAPKPSQKQAAAIVFDRNPYVVAIARKRAGDRCEVPGCEYEPFATANGDLYVEVHHIETLANDGPDTPENVACLCPAHHREIHYGRRAEELRRTLRVRRLADVDATAAPST